MKKESKAPDISSIDIFIPEEGRPVRAYLIILAALICALFFIVGMVYQKEESERRSNPMHRDVLGP